jgi:hypothetical protein
MHFDALNWIAIPVAALAGFVVGSLWYGPLFRNVWMQASGMTFEKGAEASMPLVFGGAYVLNLLGAIGISLVLGEHRGALQGAHVGAFAGFFFIAAALGVIYLFEQKPLKLWLVNAGYQVVNFAAMGTVIGAWPR